uniref:Protein ZIP4 homolog n=1 Tax=Stegastes partitus TaxID=144197 RepID=A0A3B4ZH22_9TELE
LEQCAIQLWNWAVTKNVDATISDNQKAKRHVACSLLHCCEPENPTEGVIRKQILMASKTGRTWLDCKNPQMADNFLSLASLEALYNQLTSKDEGAADVASSKADVEKDLLRILSSQAESAITQGNNQEAVVYIQRCKDMLLRVPKDTTFLSLMCYNFGVDMYHVRKLKDSAFWLQSYDIGKMNVKYAPGSDVLAKILRLLATVYLEWDCQGFQDKALSAVSLANKLNEMLESEASVEVCLRTVELLMCDDEVLAFEYLKSVCQHFESSPDQGAALVLHIELLLQRGKELLGKQKIEDIITHYTGKQLTPQALTKLHVILWDKAAKHFDTSNYSEALQWYNYSLSFFKAGQMEPNLARLQRNRASCFLLLKQLEKAKEAIKEAERCDPDCIFTQFSVYKIAVQENNVEKAEALNAMGRLSKSPVASEDRLLVSENAASCLFSLSAQIALEQSGQKDTARKALECVCNNSDDEDKILIALCLVRLVLPAAEKPDDELDVNLDILLSYVKMLQTLSHHSHMTAEQRTEEANWFRKTWNLALSCERYPDRMRDFFVLSYQLSQLCPPDRTLLMGQRTCLLMAAATSLELCRKSPHSAQIEELTQALEHILMCWEIGKTLKASSFPADPTDSLLLLYEFEARAKLNDPKVEMILESVLELENVEAKVLEAIALAMEPPAHFPLLCKKALRVALSLHKKQPQPDLAHCKCIHTLIKLSLPSGVSEVEAHVLKEVWDYYVEALSIIAAAPDDFPEMETLWLLTRAWNTGILLYSLAQYPEAEKWCGLAMSFIRHLGSLQETYETQMPGLYSEILDRLDKAKRN